MPPAQRSDKGRKRVSYANSIACSVWDSAYSFEKFSGLGVLALLRALRACHVFDRLRRSVSARECTVRPSLGKSPTAAFAAYPPYLDLVWIEDLRKLSTAQGCWVWLAYPLPPMASSDWPPGIPPTTRPLIEICEPIAV